MNYFVHRQGICESSAVGARTKIWAFAHILPGAIIGEDSNICDHVFIENDVILGNRSNRQKIVLDRPELGIHIPREFGEHNTDTRKMLRYSFLHPTSTILTITFVTTILGLRW